MAAAPIAPSMALLAARIQSRLGSLADRVEALLAPHVRRREPAPPEVKRVIDLLLAWVMGLSDESRSLQEAVLDLQSIEDEVARLEGGRRA